ncbi:MAG TPA: S-layer homology domain-containing protein, partial [Chloroflexia bacterium]|nr:S-layer homology domain-containing protein [Chloroflexia bacterium]
TFYPWINRLTRRGYIGGYECGQSATEPCMPPENRPYYRPSASATRGQLSKIVATAAQFNEPVNGQFYADVPPSNPFYEWIERLATRNIMGGYACGSMPSEPCDNQNRPYFRWANEVTRGQASKIEAGAFFPECQPEPRR